MFGVFRKQGEIKLGTRVIRGPHWIHKCEDNGEGFLGTLVACDWSNRLVRVIWDTGNSGQYRADPGEYDLRIFDNAPTGEYHTGTRCNYCFTIPIHGMKWTCSTCNIDLCTRCYMDGCHEDTHAFKRSDTEEARSCKIGTRKSCKQEIFSKGIFQGAEIVPGPSWMYGDTNGIDVGYILRITDWENKYHRGIVKVFWKDSDTEQLYRLGAEGCVDVVCSRITENATGGRIYPDHLPVVDLNSISAETPKLVFPNSVQTEERRRQSTFEPENVTFEQQFNSQNTSIIERFKYKFYRFREPENITCVQRSNSQNTSIIERFKQKVDRFRDKKESDC